MHRIRCAGLLGLALAACLLGVGGCSRSVPVSGRLLYNGEPLRGRAPDDIIMTFCPLVDGKDQMAELKRVEVDQAAGTFQLPVGLVPGKYRIAVHVLDPATGKDRLEDAFTEGTSPIVREITGQQELVLDLAKPSE
jgi:hypothetical protein